MTGPRDYRPVDPARGQAILAGTFALAGQTLKVGHGGDPFDRPAPSRRFAVALHRFEWLADLISLGEVGALEALRLTLAWRRSFGAGNAFAWSVEVMERRLFNLACASGAMITFASDAETALLGDLLVRQAKRLTSTHEHPERKAERAAVAAIAGCAALGPARAALTARSLTRLSSELPRTVLADGSHATRSPMAGLELLFDLLTLDDALVRQGRATGEDLPRTIDRLSAAARFLTLPDGRMATFQGGAGGAPGYVAAALAHDAGAGRLPDRLAFAGYHRLEGRTLTALCDAGAPAVGVWSVAACGQPLAMEMSAGSERLITGCGWTAEYGSQNADAGALRRTAAASTAMLGSGSAGAPLTGWRRQLFGPRLAGGPRRVATQRYNNAHATWLEASHDGWLKRYGLIHARRLYMDTVADELRGEDSFLPPSAKPSDGPRSYIPFAVRFHLHPDIVASIARDRRSVMLKGHAARGWWLRNDAVEVTIEDSVHFEAGVARRSSQVVLRGQVRPEVGSRVRWKITRAEA